MSYGSHHMSSDSPVVKLSGVSSVSSGGGDVCVVGLLRRAAASAVGWSVGMSGLSWRVVHPAVVDLAGIRACRRSCSIAARVLKDGGGLSPVADGAVLFSAFGVAGAELDSSIQHSAGSS